MPKTAKIIGLVFAACIVAMVVVVLISGNETDGPGSDPDVPEYPLNQDERRECFESEWKSVGEWSQKLFTKQYNANIRQKDTMNKVCNDCYETAKHSLEIIASDYIRKGYENALKQGDTAKMRQQYNGITYMKNKGYKPNDVNKVIQINQLYENIKKFIKNSITLPPAKIEEKDQILVWKSYEACVTAVATQANKFRDDPNFVYLQNIQNFVNDLSEENIKKKLSAGENSYNNKTRDLIIEYFDNRDITESNKIMLEKANEKLCKGKLLSAYLTEYRHKLENINPNKDNDETN